MARTTPAAIKDKLATLLAGELGTWSDGANTIPAIDVSPPEIPGELIPSGLECIIQLIPKSDGQPMSGGQKFVTNRWTFYLIQRKQGNYTLGRAIEKCLAGLTNPQVVPMAAKHPILAQVAVTFTVWDVLNK